MEVNSQLQASAALPPGERAHDTHWIGGSLGPRAGLDTVSKRKIPSPRGGIEPRSSHRPARSQSLFRLLIS